jgi:cation:H+ antiporter
VISEYETFAREATHDEKKLRLRDVGLVVVGSAGLVLGGTAIVNAAEYLAVVVGIPDVVVGLSIVAIGTSLPELATTVVAALRNEADIAVGNVIGSNIFNLAAILGITSLAAPIQVARSVLTEELPAVLLISLLAFPVTRSAHRVRRWEGAILLTAYCAVGVWLFRY